MEAPASQQDEVRARPSRDELRRLMTSIMERSNEPVSVGSPPSEGIVRKSAMGRKFVMAVAVVTLPVLGYLASNYLAKDPIEKEAGVPAVTVTQEALPSNAQGAAGSQLDASGHLTASRRATVSSETTGRLAEVLVEEGSHVRKGQLVARLDSRDAQLQVRLAESQLDSARLLAARQTVDATEAREKLARIRALHEQKFVSDDQVKTSEFAVQKLEAGQVNAANDIIVAERRLAIQRQFLDNMNIVAPFDGLVTERAAQVGEIVSPISAGGGFTRTGICTLVDVESIAAHVRINEKYIGRVRQGQTVTVVPRAYPELRLRGRVATIMPALERETASVEVIVELLDHDSRVLPNMSIDASFDAAEPASHASVSENTGRIG